MGNFYGNFGDTNSDRNANSEVPTQKIYERGEGVCGNGASIIFWPRIWHPFANILRIRVMLNLKIWEDFFDKIV